MSENEGLIVEEKKEEKKECECACKKYLKKILVIALGTFVGFYLALTVFAAVNKPHRMPQGFSRPGIQKMKKHHDQNFEHYQRGEKPDFPPREADD